MTETIDLTLDGVRAVLERRVAEKGSLRALAAELGCSDGYLSEVIRGTRNPGKLILDSLGLIRITVYRGCLR